MSAAISQGTWHLALGKKKELHSSPTQGIKNVLEIEENATTASNAQD